MRSLLTVAFLVASSAGVVALLGTAGAHFAPPTSTPPSTLNGTTFVSGGPSGAIQPDDLTVYPALEGAGPNATIWTEWQNNVNPNGTPGTTGGTANSTLAGYAIGTGRLLYNVSVPGHVDGVTADPALHAILVTSNEDANSAFYLYEVHSGRLVRFNYSISLEASGNGGSDSIALWQGGIYISHSNPNDTTQATTYGVHLDWYQHIAKVSPLFYDDSPARFEPAGTSGKLALTDPDTNFVMPPQSPRYAGDLATISQGDGRLIFAHPSEDEWQEEDRRGGGQEVRLTQLNLTDNLTGNLPPIDGIAVATSGNGTLFVVDTKGGTIQALSTLGWPAGTVFVTEPDDNGNPLLGTLNMTSGVITPLGNHFASPKGLLFVPAQDRFAGGWGDRDDGRGDRSGSGDDGQGNDGSAHGSWGGGSDWARLNAILERPGPRTL